MMIYHAETANLSTISEKGCIISLTTINPNFDKACVLIEPIVFFHEKDFNFIDDDVCNNNTVFKVLVA